MTRSLQEGRPDWAKPKPVTGDEPLPLSREIEPPTPFPVDALGPIGADVVKAMRTVIQAPVALLGQTILAAMNQVAQPHANVVVDGRVSPLSEFFLTLGESGERKSAGDSWALLPVRAHHTACSFARLDAELGVFPHQIPLQGRKS